MPTVGFVYITSNPKRTVLYTGASSELPIRIYKHKIGHYDGFAKKYCCYDLVWFEKFKTIGAALKREKQIKEWKWELVKK